MSESWIVFLTNGGVYSDYEAWPMCVADTEEQAKDAEKEVKAWVKGLRDDYEEDGMIDAAKVGYDENNIPDPPFGKVNKGTVMYSSLEYFAVYSFCVHRREA